MSGQNVDDRLLGLEDVGSQDNQDDAGNHQSWTRQLREERQIKQLAKGGNKLSTLASESGVAEGAFKRLILGSEGKTLMLSLFVAIGGFIFSWTGVVILAAVIGVFALYPIIGFILRIIGFFT